MFTVPFSNYLTEHSSNDCWNHGKNRQNNDNLTCILSDHTSSASSNCTNLHKNHHKYADEKSLSKIINPKISDHLNANIGIAENRPLDPHLSSLLLNGSRQSIYLMFFGIAQMETAPCTDNTNASDRNTGPTRNGASGMSQAILSREFPYQCRYN